MRRRNAALRSKLPRTFGRSPGSAAKGLLIIGTGLLVVGLWGLMGHEGQPSPPPLRLLSQPPTTPETGAPLSIAQGPFPIERSSRQQLTDGEHVQLAFDLVDYRDREGHMAHALLFPEGDRENQSEGVRHRLWNDLAAAIRAHTDEKAIVLGWWDTAQRVHFLTGREAHSRVPTPSALPQGALRDLFLKTTSTDTKDPVSLEEIAQWLVMDASQGLAALKTRLAGEVSLYWVSSIDDLSHLGEIEALTGVTLPLEIRQFPPSQDAHDQIKAVRQWAATGEDDSYLVQPLAEGGVRAYRFLTETGRQSLLARLLPFTRSLTEPLPGTQLVYQSKAGSALLVFDVSTPN